MWLLKSNRKRHLLYAIPAAFIGTILYSTGLAFGMEFKDKQYGGKFDWLDIAATEIGGLIGQILQIGLIYLIYTIGLFFLLQSNPLLHYYVGSI